MQSLFLKVQLYELDVTLHMEKLAADSNVLGVRLPH